MDFSIVLFRAARLLGEKTQYDAGAGNCSSRSRGKRRVGEGLPFEPLVENRTLEHANKRWNG